MRYWWVNQNRTFKEECEGGFLWAPLRSLKDHRDRFYWSNMERISDGDFIFSYCSKAISAVAVAKGEAYLAPKPAFEEASSYWGNDGRRVDVEYLKLKAPLELASFQEEIAGDLPNRYSPLKAKGANEGYLFELPEGAARKILSKIVEELPEAKFGIDGGQSTLDPGNGTGSDASTQATRRIGHERFRTQVHKFWKSRCAVTGIGASGLLRADRVPLDGVAHSGPRADWRAELISRAALQAS